MSLKITHFKKIVLEPAISKAKNLPTSGLVITNDENFTCLDINDDYIHQLYPFFKSLNPSIEIPDYFGEGLAGAHITIIYPEENVMLSENDLGSEHHFSIMDAFSADIGLKRYFGLTVNAPTLIELRKKYGLGKKLQFKRNLIDLHITIGTILIK